MINTKSDRRENAIRQITEAMEAKGYEVLVSGSKQRCRVSTKDGQHLFEATAYHFDKARVVFGLDVAGTDWDDSVRRDRHYSYKGNVGTKVAKALAGLMEKREERVDRSTQVRTLARNLMSEFKTSFPEAMALTTNGSDRSAYARWTSKDSAGYASFDVSFLAPTGQDVKMIYSATITESGANPASLAVNGLSGLTFEQARQILAVLGVK